MKTIPTIEVPKEFLEELSHVEKNSRDTGRGIWDSSVVATKHLLSQLKKSGVKLPDESPMIIPVLFKGNLAIVSVNFDKLDVLKNFSGQSFCLPENKEAFNVGEVIESFEVPLRGEKNGKILDLTFSLAVVIYRAKPADVKESFYELMAKDIFLIETLGYPTYKNGDPVHEFELMSITKPMPTWPIVTSDGGKEFLKLVESMKIKEEVAA